MADNQKKSGKKGRKYGRKNRRPSQARYNNERRWEKNKRRKAQTNANKTGRPVKIKVDGNWETILPG